MTACDRSDRSAHFKLEKGTFKWRAADDNYPQHMTGELDVLLLDDYVVVKTKGQRVIVPREHLVSISDTSE